LYGVYTVPYNTYNYTYTVLANPNAHAYTHSALTSHLDSGGASARQFREQPPCCGRQRSDLNLGDIFGGGVALEVQSRISDGVVQLVAPVAVGHNALDVQVDVSCLSSDFRKGRVPHVCRMCASRASRELDSLARASITAPRASRQRCGRQVRGCIAET